MGNIESLVSRAREVSEKLDVFNRKTEEISEEEHQESAELKQIKGTVRELEDSKLDEGLDERKEIILEDFMKTVKLFDRISKALEETANDLDSLIEEMKANSSEELKIIEELVDDTSNFQISNMKKAEGLAEATNTTHSNIDEVTEEIKMAQKEAKEAKKELEILIKLDKFAEKEADETYIDLESPEETLKNAKSQLEGAEEKLSGLPDKILDVREANQKTEEVVRSNTRRDVIKAGAAVSATAITGLSGCIDLEAPPEIEDLPKHLREPAKNSVLQVENSLKSSRYTKFFDLSSIHADYTIFSGEEGGIGVTFHIQGDNSIENWVYEDNAKELIKKNAVPVIGIILSTYMKNFLPNHVGSSGLRKLKIAINEGKGTIKQLNPEFKAENLEKLYENDIVEPEKVNMTIIDQIENEGGEKLLGPFDPGSPLSPHWHA